MSPRLLLRAFVNERLTAAAQEIFQVFERTIEKYEEEASSSEQEIERLRGLLLEFGSQQKTDFSQSSICKEETPSEQQQHCVPESNLSVCQWDPEPRHIKEEHHELWASQQQGGEPAQESEDADFSQSSICKEETPSEQQQHCEPEPNLSICQWDPEPRHIKEEDHELWASQQQGGEPAQESEDAGESYLPQSSVWEKNEQGHTKPPLQHQTQNSESEELSQELEEAKTVQFIRPLASTSQSLIQSEKVQEGRENKRPAARFTNQTQSDQSQGAFIVSTELSHLNSVAPDCRCHLCDKSFSSNHHLINHAFRIHSKEAHVLCAVCGKTFESTESLSVHLKSHKGSKCCHVCGKHCNSTTALTEHMASHAGVKLHRCHVCGRECSRKGDLKIHMRIHTGEKPFCCSYCQKSFTHSGHLRKHTRSHTGERLHQCHLCGRRFLQSAHLKYHLMTHIQKY